MTEIVWLVSTDPAQMLELVRYKTSDRKLRLLACACCRLHWNHLTDANLRNAIEVSERFADQEATPAQLSAASRKARRAVAKLREAEAASHEQVRRLMDAGVRDIPQYDYVAMLAAEAISGIAYKAINLVLWIVRRDLWPVEIDPTQRDKPGLLRDIFGNPCRPVTLDPTWQTSTVTALAQRMYESRDFSAMPILADALQDAGCDHPDTLDHCHDNGPHVRGCWLVDLLLEKT
jgi:hypothetical protein